MSGHETVPDWKFGQIVRYTMDRTVLAVVIGWEYRADDNPSESIVVLALLTRGAQQDPSDPIQVGEIFKPYCGWWRAVDV